MADPPGNFQIMIIQYFVTGITMKPETRKVLVKRMSKQHYLFSDHVNFLFLQKSSYKYFFLFFLKLGQVRSCPLKCLESGILTGKSFLQGPRSNFKYSKTMTIIFKGIVLIFHASFTLPNKMLLLDGPSFPKSCPRSKLTFPFDSQIFHHQIE